MFLWCSTCVGFLCLLQYPEDKRNPFLFSWKIYIVTKKLGQWANTYCKMPTSLYIRSPLFNGAKSQYHWSHNFTKASLNCRRRNTSKGREKAEEMAQIIFRRSNEFASLLSRAWEKRFATIIIDRPEFKHCHGHVWLLFFQSCSPTYSQLLTLCLNQKPL